MKKNNVALLSGLLIATTIGMSSCGNQGGTTPEKPDKPGSTGLEPLINNHDPFDYPGNFEAPELLVDGVRDEAYDTKGSTKLYIDKGTDHELEATFYRGSKALFVYFDVKDTNLLSYKDGAGDDVTHGDSVEFYLDTKNNAGKRPQIDDFQFNFGVHNKTRIMQGSGSEWGNWNGLVQYENVLDGTLNKADDKDKGWKCEVMIPYKELGITQDSVLGVALGRVDKFGQGNAVETDWKWYGLNFQGHFVEPQTIDNYIALVGREFYLRENIPLIKTVSGVVKDSAGNVLSDVTVKAGQLSATTDAKGLFKFESFMFNHENSFEFSKQGYVTRVVNITKEDAAKFENDVTLGEINLVSADQLINTTFKGTVRNAKHGDLADVTVTLGEHVTKTNAQGEFTLPVSFLGEAKLTFEKAGFISTSTIIAPESIVPNGDTLVGEIGIDLEYGIFNFGGSRQVIPVTGQATRTLEGLKFRYVTDSAIDGNNFVEFWIDAKSTGQARDNTDYTFKFNKGGVVDATNCGTGKKLDTSKIVHKYYQEGTKHVIDVLIRYDLVGINLGEVVGISAGILWNGDWDGWNGFKDQGFVAPEVPARYARFGTDNSIYVGQNNVGGEVDPFVYKDLGLFGFKFGAVRTEITRDIEDSVFIKLTRETAWTPDLKVEFYIDTNKNPTEQRNNQTYRLDVWGNADVSLFGNYTGVAAHMNDLTAEAKPQIAATVNDKTLTLKIPYKLLGITKDTTFGISQGLWNETKRDWDGWGYEADGYTGFVDPAIPSKYVRINGNNEVTKDTLTYVNLGTVGGKSKGEIKMSTLAMKMSRQEADFAILDIANKTYNFEASRNGKENLEFYFDFGAKARCGESITNPGANFRDEKTYKVFIKPDGTLGFAANYPGGKEAILDAALYNEIFVVTKLDNNRIQLRINFAKLPLEQDKTIGFSAGVWNEEIKDWCPFNFGKERRVECAGHYLRIDQNGKILAD